MRIKLLLAQWNKQVSLWSRALILTRSGLWLPHRVILPYKSAVKRLLVPTVLRLGYWKGTIWCWLAHSAKIHNRCMLEGRFPTLWKIATIKPQLKTPAATQAKDYRPPTIAYHCFEQVFEQSGDWKRFNKFDKHQYTYRLYQSMVDALARIIYQASFGSEKGAKLLHCELS